MKNKTKLSKRIVAFFVFMILTFNSFAAVVSDNDGPTFVTKAEFDAVRNSFTKQISDYYSSIEGKIDGAIASYLDGIKFSVVTQIPCLLNNIQKLEYGKQDTIFTDLSSLNVATNDLYGVEGLWNCAYCNGGQGSAAVGGYRFLWWNNGTRWGPTGKFYRGDNTTTNQALYGNHIYTKERKWVKNGSEYFYLMSDTTIEGWHRLLLYQNLLVYASPNVLCDPAPWTIDLTDLKYPKQVSNPITISGSTFTGYKGHLYEYKDKQKYDGATYNASSNINSITINTIDDEKCLQFDDSTAITNIIQNGPCTTSGATPGASSNIGERTGNFYFKYLRQKRFTHNQNEWINISASTILNTPIYKYNGIPICRELVNPGQISLELNFSKVECNSKKPTSCTFMITNYPFPNGANSSVPQFDSTHPNGWLLNETLTLTDDDTLYTNVLSLPEKLFESIDKNIGVTLYIKCVPNQGAVSVSGVKDTLDYVIYN